MISESTPLFDVAKQSWEAENGVAIDEIMNREPWTLPVYDTTAAWERVCAKGEVQQISRAAAARRKVNKRR